MTGYYFGKDMYEKYGELVRSKLSGKTISKRVIDGDIKDYGLKYCANLIGIGLYDLLECLEGMCHNYEATEISDYEYKVH